MACTPLLICTLSLAARTSTDTPTTQPMSPRSGSTSTFRIGPSGCGSASPSDTRPTLGGRLQHHERAGGSESLTDIGLQGIVHAAPESPWLERVRPIIEKKIAWAWMHGAPPMLA